MTRESKLALIIGFVLVLVVGVLVSDHFSQASTMVLDTQETQGRIATGPITALGSREKEGINNAMQNRQPASAQPEKHTPIEILNSQSASANAGTSDSSSILDRAFNHVQETEFPQAAQISPRATRPLRAVKYATYKVVAGDTLIGIARRMLGNGERWTLIHQLNADVLGPDAILKIGVYLKLPNDAKVNTPRRSNTPGLSSGRTYTVVSGDTLGQISMRLLGTSRRADEIAELNGLESANDIRIGMTLKIPSK